MKILVLQGGDSPEREVSLRSASSVIKALKQLGLDYSVCDPKDNMVGLKKACQEADLVLPIMHGINGEDGVVQDFLDSLSVKYLGADARVSRITFDKYETHKELEKIAIQMPEYELVNKNSFTECILSKKPYVLKPICGGSSIDTLIIRNNVDQSIGKARAVLEKYDEMLLEELIDGIEVSAPVLGSTALPLIQIVPPAGEEFDYENKYNGASQEICPLPTNVLSGEVQNTIKKTVLRAHEHLGVRHLSRSEFMIDKDGRIFMLELNTIPGLTDASLYPKSALVAGYDMPKLILEFIKMIEKEA